MNAEAVRAMFQYDPQSGALTRAKAAGRWGRIPAGERVGSLCSAGYLQTRVQGKKQMVHRLAWLLAYGQEPEGEIDHINGIRTDNRLCNLRDVGRATNMQNQRKAHSQSGTGLLGVAKCGRYFQARICIDGKQRYLGSFKTPEAAHARYVSVKRQVHEGNTL